MNAKKAAGKSASPKKSKGQIFKEKNGYSKTMKRNMKKNGCATVEDYREIRKKRRKEK